jgi:hypothetical protein
MTNPILKRQWLARHCLSVLKVKNPYTPCNLNNLLLHFSASSAF